MGVSRTCPSSPESFCRDFWPLCGADRFLLSHDLAAAAGHWQWPTQFASRGRVYWRWLLPVVANATGVGTGWTRAELGVLAALSLSCFWPVRLLHHPHALPLGPRVCRAWVGVVSVVSPLVKADLRLPGWSSARHAVPKHVQ